MKRASTEAALRLLGMAESKTPPPRKITELRGRIEAATKAAGEVQMRTGRTDTMAVKLITDMVLERDRLYALWATGELDSEPVIITS